jgi:hypothetical protein
MNQISLYLAKFKHLRLESDLVRETVASAIKDELGAVLDKEKINFRDGNLTISVTGPLKTEIVLKKDLILKRINKDLEKVNKGFKKLY